MKKWSLHGCGKVSFDPICRKYGCARVHLQTPWFHVAVALTPDARFAHLDGRADWIMWSAK